MPRKPSPKGFEEPKASYGSLRSGGHATGEIARGKRKLPEPEALPDGTVRYFFVLGPKGRVLLPASVREVMGLREGDVITGWLKDGELRLHSHLHGLRKIQTEGSSLAKGTVYASEELIAERREEAAEEAEENLRWLRARG